MSKNIDIFRIVEHLFRRIKLYFHICVCVTFNFTTYITAGLIAVSVPFVVSVIHMHMFVFVCKHIFLKCHFHHNNSPTNVVPNVYDFFPSPEQKIYLRIFVHTVRSVEFDVVWTPPFFRISSFVLCRRTKHIQVRNDMRMSK